MLWWPEPSPGDIVWCRFPINSSQHEPSKSRPALVLSIFPDEFHPNHDWVAVAYGTSQKTSRLYGGEFLVSKALNPEAYRLAGLSYDTKFNLGRAAKLPFNADYFDVPPHAPFGQSPKMGLLHPTLVTAARAAYLAAKDGTH